MPQWQLMVMAESYNSIPGLNMARLVMSGFEQSNLAVPLRLTPANDTQVPMNDTHRHSHAVLCRRYSIRRSPEQGGHTLLWTWAGAVSG